MTKYKQLRNIIVMFPIVFVFHNASASELTAHQIMTHMHIKLEKGFTQKDLADFKKIVQELDLDSDGHLTIDEYAKNSYFRRNLRGIQGFFRAADMNLDGKMSLNEYAWQRIITDEARRIFFALDNNQDRQISKLEFLKNKIWHSKDIARNIFKAFDTDGNGELFLPEYLRKWSRWARSGRQLGVLY